VATSTTWALSGAWAAASDARKRSENIGGEYRRGGSL